MRWKTQLQIQKNKLKVKSTVNNNTGTQIAEQTVPMVKTEKDLRNKTIKKVTLPAVGKVHVKAPAFHGSTGRCISDSLKLMHADKCLVQDIAVSLVQALKEPAAELLQKVPPDAELIKSLELRYGD